jgi:hypothetical protein
MAKLKSGRGNSPTSLPDPRASSMPRQPYFPPITRGYVRYLRSIDASPELIAHTERVIERQEAASRSSGSTLSRVWRALTHRQA